MYKALRWYVDDVEISNCLYTNETNITAKLEGVIDPICGGFNVLDVHKDLQKRLNGEVGCIYPQIDFGVFNEYKATPKINRVIFNNPATIIFWKDGTKTVVKCQSGDTYDEEKGFVMAYLKKLLGNDNTFNKMIKRYCIEQYLPDYLKEE